MKVILLMAMTADGKISRNRTELVDWTGKADKQYFVQATRKAGVMIMGSKTFDTIGTVLPGRKSIVMTRDRSRKSSHPDLVFTDQKPADIIRDLARQGHDACCLIGGATINALFLAEKLITEIHLTLVARVFGRGLDLFDPGPAALVPEGLETALSFMDSRLLDADSILLRYRVR